ncbi:MAG: NADH-quinone oxidoreductase subunit C [Chloroflexi bacterium]|nr:NADH-quinone oxidoreductase subunit C [Chloroflexota bacterium]
MAEADTKEAVEEQPPEPGPVGRLFQAALPDVEFGVIETPLNETLTVTRDDFARVMDAAHNDERLSFDYLRCLSGVDYLTELETVYHLYSFSRKHTIAIKVRCPYEDPHVPTVSHIWHTANWHEREAHELYGIVYDGHPDLRPLLTEEGLGYYIMRKSHPLAEIEDWQEDYLDAIQKAKEQAAAASGEAPPVDEKARKIELAQKKAQIIKKTRDKARDEGLSAEDQKAAVQAALKQFEEEQAAADAAQPGAAPAKPVDERAAKIQLAQQKGALIKKTRDAARAKGLSSDEEKQAVAEALKKFSEEREAAAPAPAKPVQDRAAKIKLAQEKAVLIKKTRDEARAKGLSSDEEKQAVSEALKKFSEEQKG